MKRFIVVCFAFLALAFYQMSGGADFKPRLATIPQASTIEVTQTSRQAEEPAQVQAASLIAGPAISPSLPEPAPVAFVAPAVAPARPADETRPVPAEAVQPAAANPIAQPLVLASLEQGLSGLTGSAPVTPATAPATPAPPPADIREITATRVNMRDGPGTTYPVLTRLSLGDEVEILEVLGNGWLRLRTLPEQRIGWIAASLVSKAKR